VIRERRRDEWVRDRALSFYIAQLQRLKKLPRPEEYLDPGTLFGGSSRRGARASAKGETPPGVQGINSMKNAIFQFAHQTGTEVKQGDKVLIAARK